MPRLEDTALIRIDELRNHITAGRVTVKAMDYEPGCDGVNRLWFDLCDRMDAPPWVSTHPLDGSTGDAGHAKRAGSKGVGE